MSNEITNNPYPIEESTFNTWLEAKGGNESLGIPMNGRNCMFSNFLRETYGQTFIITYRDRQKTAWYWRDADWSTEYEFPAWALPKMRVFDHMVDDENYEISKDKYLARLEVDDGHYEYEENDEDEDEDEDYYA